MMGITHFDMHSGPCSHVGLTLHMDFFLPLSGMTFQMEFFLDYCLGAMLSQSSAKPKGVCLRSSASTTTLAPLASEPPLQGAPITWRRGHSWGNGCRCKAQSRVKLCDATSCDSCFSTLSELVLLSSTAADFDYSDCHRPPTFRTTIRVQCDCTYYFTSPPLVVLAHGLKRLTGSSVSYDDVLQRTPLAPHNCLKQPARHTQ